MIQLLRQFELLFSERTVTAALCGLGLSDEPQSASTGMAVWCHSGLPPVVICWVLIADPDGKFKNQALLRSQKTPAVL